MTSNERARSSRPAAAADRSATLDVDALGRGEPCHADLPGSGELHLDRLLPFVVVLRPTSNTPEGTDRLLRSEAAYAIAPVASTGPRSKSGVRALEELATLALRETGAFLTIEVWTAAADAQDQIDAAESGLPPQARFRIHSRGGAADGATRVLVEALEKIRLQQRSARVEVSEGAPEPPGLPPLLSRAAQRTAAPAIGIEVTPIWVDAERSFPVLLRSLTRRFSRAIKRACFEFTRTESRHRPQHFHSLGQRAVVRGVFEIDRQLAAIDSSLETLLWMTPMNATRAYDQFRRDRYDQAPRFLYRPLPVDPDQLSRRLYKIDLGRIEDPTLAHVLTQKRDELALRIELSKHRSGRRALPISIAIYDAPSDPLIETATKVLSTLPPQRPPSGRSLVGAEAFATEARELIEDYRREYPLVSEVHVRDDLGATLMVSRGHVLVGQEAALPRRRVRALLAHEVETHVLTHANGSAQPLELLRCGTEGYEALQEGLAVLSEHLVGGLSASRLRLLAGRVVAAAGVVRGAEFVETFRELRSTWGFAPPMAYTIAMRVHRGGGFVKDAVYLRGLVEVLAYLSRGRPLDPLYIGKISLDDVTLVQELERRRILRPVPLRPRFLETETARKRLEAVGRGVEVVDLVD
ncbi:MAG: DUF1704 domain-containing protein [Planctomycetes bacterium]|nr:DUF1704 domain-containing protein [Planctomycetota bacterium]